MKYGFEQNILQSPISLILSIFLLLGVINFGTFVQKQVIKKFEFIDLKENIFFSPIIGIYCLLYPLYFVLILEFQASFFIKTIAYLLLLLGIFQLFSLKKNILKINNKNFKNKIFFLIIILLFFLLFLISASPITHADAVDYHFLGGLNLLNLGHFYKEILPMHNNLISLGEIMISIGLAVKAEQFVAMIQTVSLLALIPLFSGKKNIFLILILVCPITFFLVSSSKPQLIFCLSSLLIFILLINYSNKLSKKQLKFFFPLSIMILSLNSLAKYSFTLSSALLGTYFLYIMYKNKLLIFSILTLLLIFLFTFFPFWLFRFENFGTNFFEIIQSPLPINIYGYDTLNNLLKSGSISFTGVFFPKEVQEFSTTFGPLFLLFPFISSKTILVYKKELSIIFIFFILVFIFGSNLPRFLFEGFLWSSYLISKNTNYKSNFFKIFEKLIYLQVIIIIPIYLFFIITIFPASIIESLKSKVLKKTINGFELAEWTNKNLDKNDILLSTHRSISLFKNQTYSNIYTWHTNPKNNESLNYYNFLKEKKVNRILFYGNKLETKIYENCLGKELFFKENVGSLVGRNPFTKKEHYNGWIFELKYNKFPDCLIR